MKDHWYDAVLIDETAGDWCRVEIKAKTIKQAKKKLTNMTTRENGHYIAIRSLKKID